MKAILPRARAERLGSQPWPWPNRPRVVIEDADKARGLETATAFRQAGYAVAVCPGPAGQVSCPLERLEECLLVDGADVVVWRLPAPAGRGVLEGLLRRRGGRGLVVELEPEELERRRGELEGCELVAAPASPERLVEAVSSREHAAAAVPGVEAGGSVSR